ncbi:MAG: TIGR03915 family putative DNA repair protein [Clostridiales bacterium]|nr:TIGR03915 family putative DNA repair protein [Clostridiales bacterium]
MYYYTFDGTFEGFLTVIFYIYKNKEQPQDIAVAPGSLPLFASARPVTTRRDLAARVAAGIRQKMGEISYRRTYYVFLSDYEGAYLKIYHYLDLGFQQTKKELHNHLTDSTVAYMQKVSQQVTLESHRLKGLLRFQKQEGFFYAPCSPRHDVLELLAGHFSRRLDKQNWLIHDIGRGKAVVCADGNWQLADLKQARLPANEEPYRALWQQYFSAINIDERRNPKQQKSYMPVRYWEFLPEME